MIRIRENAAQILDREMQEFREEIQIFENELCKKVAKILEQQKAISNRWVVPAHLLEVVNH